MLVRLPNDYDNRQQYYDASGLEQMRRKGAERAEREEQRLLGTVTAVTGDSFTVEGGGGVMADALSPWLRKIKDGEPVPPLDVYLATRCVHPALQRIDDLQRISAGRNAFRLGRLA